MSLLSNDYHFLTRWRVPDATIDEVYAVIADAEALPGWWPSVYLAVNRIDERRFLLHTKGWLPYTLRWTLVARENDPPFRAVIGAEGDFDGRGIWTLAQEGPDVALAFDWKLLAEKPLLRLLSPLLKPAFAANHRWAMAQGEISLRREVRRRRGQAAPPPPGPTSWEPWAAFALGAAVAAALVLARSPRRTKEKP